MQRSICRVYDLHRSIIGSIAHRSLTNIAAMGVSSHSFEDIAYSGSLYKKDVKGDIFGIWCGSVWLILLFACTVNLPLRGKGEQVQHLPSWCASGSGGKNYVVQRERAGCCREIRWSRQYCLSSSFRLLLLPIWSVRVGKISLGWEGLQLLVGYDVEDGKKYWIVKNIWASKRSIDGFF